MKFKAFVGEIKRRNLPRATILYAGAAWALAQGIAQLGPSVDAPEWITRWFLVAAAIGFPFWIGFAWIYELRQLGLKHGPGAEATPMEARHARRVLDYWIIGVLALAVVLLLTNQFVLRRDATSLAGRADSPQDAAALDKAPTKSIAVLPLENASGDKDQVYFSDGLTEDLINALSQFDGLKVIARNSAFKFRDSTDDTRTIGARLGVAHLLEGSVRHAGDTVRVTAQLVDVKDGSTLWSQHYDRPYKDLFALQDEIANAVAGALKARLLGNGGAKPYLDLLRPASGNLEAFNLFLQSRAIPSNGKAAALRKIELLTQATRLDPGYSTAYANIAINWTNIAMISTGADAASALHAAHAALDRARALGEHAGVHLAAGVLATADRDWTRAAAEYRQSDQMLPSPAAKANLGSLLLQSGHAVQAAALFRQALAQDPMRLEVHAQLAYALAVAGRTNEADQTIDEALELAPANGALYAARALVRILAGDAKGALDASAKIPDEFSAAFNRTMALQIGPDRAAADAALQALIAAYHNDSPYQIADVYALRNDREATFQWLEAARISKDPGLTSLLQDPVTLRYRDDPRYEKLLEAVGLPTDTPRPSPSPSPSPSL